jgi:hypothetical protein
VTCGLRTAGRQDNKNLPDDFKLFLKIPLDSERMFCYTQRSPMK